MNEIQREGGSGERVLRCENCGRLTGTHFSALYDCASSADSPHDFRELEVVPLAALEDAETALREVEEVLERDRGPGVVGAEGSHEEQAIREALAILKRHRTTTTEEVTHVRAAQG